MTLAQLTAAAVIIATLVAVLTFARSMVRAGRAEKLKREEARRQQYDAGRASREDEIARLRSESGAALALMRSQRDDARRERDEAQRRADTFEDRYNNLRDRGNG